MTTNENSAAVRVCAIADIQCSRGCGTGACKREQPAAAPIAYDGLTEEFTDEVARLTNDAPGIREAVAIALKNCNAIIAPQGDPVAAPIEGQICQHCDCIRPLHDLDCPVAVEGMKPAPSPADERAADEPVRIHKLWSSGGCTGINDYLMTDYSIRTLKVSETGRDKMFPPNDGSFDVISPDNPYARTLTALKARAASATTINAMLASDPDWRDVDSIIRMLAYSDAVSRARAANLLRKIKAAVNAASANETVPKWVFDNLVNTLQPAWDYIQTHQEQFNAQAGDDKKAILVEFFLRAANETGAEVAAIAQSEETRRVVYDIALKYCAYEKGTGHYTVLHYECDEDFFNFVHEAAGALSRSPAMAAEAVAHPRAWLLTLGNRELITRVRIGLDRRRDEGWTVTPLYAGPQLAQAQTPCKCRRVGDWRGFHHQLCDAATPAQADARVELTDALRRAREELSIVEWENDPPSRIVKLFDEIDALLQGANQS